MDRDAYELARPLVATAGGRRVAVVGGGWAGLAAAVEARRLGHAVTLYEMAPQLGGRARSVTVGERVLDNGQHILIGAYLDTLALLRSVGIDLDKAFVRTPLRITMPDGTGLQLRQGSPITAFGSAVWRQRRWRRRDRLALLSATTAWALHRFRCDPSLTVAALTATLPQAVRTELINPLCIAALNTPAEVASAGVFLRVLKDALFRGPGSADLLLPRVGLSELFANPAQRWLESNGATLRLARRVDALEPADDGWHVDGESYDFVILAATPTEAARLTRSIAPAWSAVAASLRFEPIVTVYAACAAATRLREPMLAMPGAAGAPAQFVFDRGQLGGPPGLLAFVISGAQAWVDRGPDATTTATLAQARKALGIDLDTAMPLRALTEKRATFRCTPNLQRPGMQIAPRLYAAGDHVEGPYPATLEGAAGSGLRAARAVDAVSVVRRAPPVARR